MLELVMVLIVVGILAAMAVSRIETVSITLPAQAEQLAADIRYVQSAAMVQGVRHRLCLSAGGYTIAATSCASPIPHPATGTTDPITFQGVTLTGSGLPDDYIAFDSLGVPYSTDPGTALADAATITLTSNQGGSATVTITPETGRVTP